MKALLLASALALFGASAWAQNIEYGTDRSGSDLMGFALPPNGSPQNCEGACYANPNCVAWTFVRTGHQGPTPRCWLKGAVPARSDNPNAVSGVK
jgi:hypothetical protein